MKKYDPDLSILVIDDDAMVKSILVEYLQNMGFKSIYAARDSEEALKILQDSKFRIDLIISDWEMPEVTGLTLLKAVRNNPARASTPFMLVTSQRSMERFKISQAKQWAVDSYMIKPFRQEMFRTKVFEVMGWDEKVA
jgi:two-component system, chemotaxis family, chemotaxis protein CheY